MLQLVLEIKPLKNKQHELSVELHGVKTTQKTALIEQTDMKTKQVLLQQRMAQVFGTSILRAVLCTAASRINPGGS